MALLNLPVCCFRGGFASPSPGMPRARGQTAGQRGAAGQARCPPPLGHTLPDAAQHTICRLAQEGSSLARAPLGKPPGSFSTTLPPRCPSTHWGLGWFLPRCRALHFPLLSFSQVRRRANEQYGELSPLFLKTFWGLFFLHLCIIRLSDPLVTNLSIHVCS